MIGQPLNWLKTHQIFSGLLVVGLLVPLSVTVGGIPLSESIFGKDGAHEVSSQTNSPIHVEPPKASWHLTTYEGNQAKLIEQPRDPIIRRVEMTRGDPTAGWHIQLSHKPIIVEKKGWYSLRFRARADDVRSMLVAVSQDHHPWKMLGLYRLVPLMRQWQNYEWEFLATEDDINAQIIFYLGERKVPVEVTAIRLLKLSHKKLGWHLNVREGSEAGLRGIPELPLATRVAITKTFNNTPKHIQLIQQGVKLQENKQFRLRFQARADKPRDMYVAVRQTQYPWNELGLKQQVSLTSDWQLFDLDFVAKNTDENARLIFDLGGHNIPVDINAALLQRNFEMAIPNGDSSAPSLERAPVGLHAVEPG